MSIGNFRHKGLEELFVHGATKRIDRRHHKVALLILDLLDRMAGPADCVGVRGFHGLKGNRKGVYAMSVSGNYRITFRWRSARAWDVDFEDYH